MLNVDSGRAYSAVAQQLATVQPTVALPRLDSFRVVALGPTAAHGMLWKHWYNPNAFFSLPSSAQRHLSTKLLSCQ